MTVSKSEWEFPPELKTFNPKGTRFEKVFQDPIALVAYAQYRRKHLVSDKENEWLPIFAINFANDIRVQKAYNKINRGEEKVTLDETVHIWMEWWQYNPMFPYIKTHAYAEQWRVILQPILPFINGEKTLQFVENTGQCSLITQEVAKK